MSRNYTAGVVNIADGVRETNVTLAATAVPSAAPAGGEGTYDLWADIDMFIKVKKAAAAAVTVLTGYKIYANNVIPVFIPAGYIVDTIAGGAGTMSWQKTGK